MKRKYFVIFLITVFCSPFIFSTSFAPPISHVPGIGDIKSEPIKIRDVPVINKFSSKPVPRLSTLPAPAVTSLRLDIQPRRVVRGANVILSWEVEPGPLGTPIAHINIVKTEGPGSRLNLTSSDKIGEIRIAVPTDAPIGSRMVYGITAVNFRGISTTKTLTLEIIDPPEPPDLVPSKIGCWYCTSPTFEIYFEITNNGGDFLGTLTLFAKVNNLTTPIWPYYEDNAMNALVPLEIPDFNLPHGETKRFMMRGKAQYYNWTSGTYEFYLQIRTDNTYEIIVNNEYTSEGLLMPYTYDL